MKAGAILIPMLGGFLLTVAVVSWHSGWWQPHAAPRAADTEPSRVEVRRSNLRVIPIHLTTGPAPTPAPTPATVAHAIPAPAEPEPSPAPYAPPPVPRADPGNSPERLDASARKFARGSRADED